MERNLYKIGPCIFMGDDGGWGRGEKGCVSFKYAF